MLALNGVSAFYGKSQVLNGVDLRVDEGEIVALLGRNGAGRSTLCKSVMGLVDWRGEISLEDCSLRNAKPFDIARMGIGYVPENRDVFPGLTVRQNLSLGLKQSHDAKASLWTIDDVFDQFENLQERADVDAASLSGGEQQMLAICRTLMGNPKVVLIDEPTEGLSPMITQSVAALIKQIAARGTAVLLVEQKLAIALDIADRVSVLGHGRVQFDAPPSELVSRQDVRQQWLEV